MAVTSSRALEEGVDPAVANAARGAPGARIDFKEAFWMATTGGGMALNAPIGLFKEGCAFDAMVVDATVKDSNLILWEGSGPGRRPVAENYLQRRPAQHRQGVGPGPAGEGRRLRRGRDRPAWRPPRLRGAREKAWITVSKIGYDCWLIAAIQWKNHCF